MKTIGSVKEDLSVEKRVSITPESVKKFTDLGLSINLEKKYAEHLGINDEDYKKNGANIFSSKEEVFKKSEIILKDLQLSLYQYIFLQSREKWKLFFQQKDLLLQIQLFSLSLSSFIFRIFFIYYIDAPSSANKL